MRWLTERRPPPKSGQRRIRIIFAFSPKKCDDGYTYWLCWVQSEEFFVHPEWRVKGWWTSNGRYSIYELPCDR